MCISTPVAPFVIQRSSTDVGALHSTGDEPTYEKRSTAKLPELLLAVVGTYSANKNVFDLWVMLGFGVAGYVLRKLEYDLAPFVIAFVLAPLLEQSLRQSLVMSPDGAMILVQRPVTAGLLAASAVQAR